MNTLTPLLDSQRGFSMVELMVAMVLGLVLLGGLVQIMLSNKEGYTFQQAQSYTQEMQRFSFRLMEEYTSLAGYRQNPQDSLETAFPAVAAANGCAAMDAGQVVAAYTPSAGFCVRYQRREDDDLEEDCMGVLVSSPNAPLVASFRLENLRGDGTQLVCQSHRNNANELADHVEAMQVEYGERMASGNVRFQAVPDDWSRVIAIRVALLTTSEQENLVAPTPYNWPPDSATQVTPTDRRLYRVSQKTIYLPNTQINVDA